MNTRYKRIVPVIKVAVFVIVLALTQVGVTAAVPRAVISTTSASTSASSTFLSTRPRRWLSVPNAVVSGIPRGGGEDTMRDHFDEDNVTNRQVSHSSAAATVAATTWNAVLSWLSLWHQNPFVTAAVICAVKAGLADIVAQRYPQQQSYSTSAGGSSSSSNHAMVAPFDVRRCLSFMLYGALYQGVAQEFIYNHLYTHLFGSASTPAVVLRKVLFDAFFHNALVCIPMAYVVKAWVFHKSVGSAVRAYRDDVVQHGLLYKYYALWMPVNAILFTWVPPRGRIPLMACVSFFWMILLSSTMAAPSAASPKAD